METDRLELVMPETAGDPMGARKWVRRSWRQRSPRLAHLGHAASAPTVSRLLQTHAYVRRGKAKETEAGSPQPDRDPQCHDSEAQQQALAAAGAPIRSVDTKPK